MSILSIAAVIGLIGQLIGGFHLGGFIVSMGIGFVGALLGSWLARELALPDLLIHFRSGIHPAGGVVRYRLRIAGGFFADFPEEGEERAAEMRIQ
jgi:uncharacterized membrane protein YeaQ/YmgE (transglycosylase-associated protein family)